MNEILGVVELILVFASVAFISWRLGKCGLIAYVSAATILANILVCKNIRIFGMDTTMGNVLFSSIYLSTDILTEAYGREASKKAVNCGLISALVFILVTLLSVKFVPNEQDIAHSSMETLFTFSARTTTASVLMFYLSNVADVYLFDWMKSKKPDLLWVRNNVCTIVCNCLENFGFMILAFTGIYPLVDCLKMICAVCLLEIIISLLDTPFVYLGSKLSKKE